MNEKISEYIYSMKDEILQDLADLVAIPSVKGEPRPDAPFGEEPKNALMKMREICEDEGIKTTVFENAVLCADYCISGEAPELVILAHLDVVPISESGWDTNPFRLTEKNGVLYGRGVIDDKGPAVAALWALKAVIDLKLPLKKGVRLIFGTDEENGSADLELYKKHDKFPPKVFTPDGSFPVINIEKGMLRTRFSGTFGGVKSIRGGSIPNAVPDRAEAEFDELASKAVSDAIYDFFCANQNSKLIFNYPGFESVTSLTCCGKAAHASTPESGENAVTALIALINRVIDNETLKGLERLFPFGETDGAALGLKCSDESGALTCVLSTLNAENGTISGTVDIRFPTCTNLKTVKDKLFSALDNIGLKCETILGDEPHIVPADSGFVKTLLSVYEQVEGEQGKCIAIGGGTYVHNIEGGVAFGAERGDTDYHMHGDNEFITVDELLKDAVLYAHAIIAICE